jgi:hypothetical protein
MIERWVRRLAHFIVAMALDRFGFLLVELRQLGSRRTVDAQKLVEFGMQCQIIATVGSLDILSDTIERMIRQGHRNRMFLANKAAILKYRASKFNVVSIREPA